MIADLHFSASKTWWGYLGILSHPALLQHHEQYGVFFDDPAHIPAKAIARPSTRFFFTFWDGLQTEAPLLEARRILGHVAPITALVVGESDLSAGNPWDIRQLYPAGPLHFTAGETFTAASQKLIRRLRLKNLLIPFKNITQPNTPLIASLSLLFGPSRIVFCGVHELSAPLLSQFSERHNADPALFHDRPLFLHDPDQSFANFLRHLDRNTADFNGMLASGAINEEFFLTLARVLQRSYFVERLKHERIPLFTNSWTTGANINVYTTPSYRQHRFLDFGSMAGPGNYPRLADLAYFGKRTLSVPAINEKAREQNLADLFNSQWNAIAPSFR